METSDYTTKDMFKDIGKDTAMIIAAHAIAVGVLVGAGYIVSKVQTRKAKKAAK